MKVILIFFKFQTYVEKHIKTKSGGDFMRSKKLSEAVIIGIF